MKVILTVNSPVTASKPTWMVCSKSEGRDISGRSFSFFLFAAEGRGKWSINGSFLMFLNDRKESVRGGGGGGVTVKEVKDTHFCLPRGRWSAGGLSCFSLQEPLEAVWRRDSVMKSLGNYCSFSRGGLVVFLQYRHYQTCLVALTRSWSEKNKNRKPNFSVNQIWVLKTVKNVPSVD